MKTIIITAAILLLSTQAYAMPGITNGGHAACLSRTWYEDMVKFVAANDQDSFAAYIDSKKCVVAKEGLRVTVIDGPGMFGGSVSFVFKGVKFWGARESLKYGE